MTVAISATLAANEALEQRRRAGLPVLHLAFGEAGLNVHPTLENRLGAAAGRGAYGPVAGSTTLRNAAAGYWRRRGLAADPGLVVAGPGSKPLLYALLLAIGGSVVVPRPSWVSYAAQTRLLGTEPVFVPIRPGEGGVPDPDALPGVVARARAAGHHVRSVVVTLPDNPTGTLARPGTVRRLCEVARELDLVIIADEIYRDLVFDQGADFPSPARFAPERTVITTALSKSLALGGWRIGVALLPEELHGLRDRLAGVASEIWSSASGPVQEAAAYAFGEPPEITGRIAASRRLHAAVATAMAERFADAGTRVAAPQGGFYCYPEFSGPGRDDLRERHGIETSADLAEFLLEEYGVGVLPGSAFGDPPDALRIRVATSLLYGETPEQRDAALGAPDPLALPWIADALDRATEVLSDLTSKVREPAPASA
ncbi:pyridoxal phosphate-dependent aminotransferase [Actinoallomurus purpureus]|uniref:pyridoxal phosphate-dependent aminotransferase n=1 Tax=Actinoallomurus purpureus TaxID=478114 RepID=UPI00209360D4|nr:pyridoxal phosphate-dependent aminotransferase [Actinoallomurus purpureus]MCO6005762.1 pyridoxal phosphate-dependent aminotransferase [Actinoallomurus purpureus]